VGNFDTMKSAYRASSELVRERMRRERGEDLELLQRVQESDIVVVRGCYDRVEEVLALLEIPHVAIDIHDLEDLPLLTNQLLIINCPGQGASDRVLAKVRRFVLEGGFLFTTDWALLHILEVLFPEFVKFNQRRTADDVVKIEISDASNELINGILSDQAEPLWWLEGSSFPIQLVDESRVKVLIASKELAQKYGESPVVVEFHPGQGRVLHMISHYYLQRAELRTQRQQSSWKGYVSELGVEDSGLGQKAEFQDLSVGEVESAYSSAQFISNVVVEQSKRRVAAKRVEASDDDLAFVKKNVVADAPQMSQGVFTSNLNSEADYMPESDEIQQQIVADVPPLPKKSLDEDSERHNDSISD
jgi:hypothetical protein